MQLSKSLISLMFFATLKSLVFEVQFIHGPSPCESATTQPTTGRVHWCSSARPRRATYVIAGDGPPLFEKPFCLASTNSPLHVRIPCDTIAHARSSPDCRLCDLVFCIARPNGESSYRHSHSSSLPRQSRRREASRRRCL